MNNEWPFALLYGLLTLFFLWLLVTNIRVILKHKRGCGPSGCSPFGPLKRPKKKSDDEDLGDQ